MLLVQADLIKSVWFVIFPIVTYTRGPVASDSTFCQVSGFFFAVGIESSDVAVLLIAVHSAMYIFRPKSGLYPYRWLAYGAYVLVPILFASLAFLDGGYKNVGYFCYLPTGTGWARLALSWVPRHILFAIIILTYSCIYVYVRRRILNYERRASAAPHKQQNERRLTLPSAAVYRDRIRSFPSTLKPSAGRYKDRIRSVSFGNTYATKWTEDTPTTGPIAWNFPRFTEAPSSELESIATDEQDPHSSSTIELLGYPVPSVSPSLRASAQASSYHSSVSAESWKLARVSEETTAPALQPPASTVGPVRPSSCATIPAMFPVCQKALRATEPPLPPTSSSSSHPGDGDGDGAALTPHISHDPLTSHVSRNRDKIRRQLRSLFVYPLLYLVIWIFPLVNQGYGYRNSPLLPGDRPAWVMVCSLASLAVQGLADSAVFTAREKPWRHVGGKGFWGSVRRGWCVWGRGKDGVGRTREEMLVEVRIARARREKEMRDEMGTGEKKRVDRRHWWDFEEEEAV